MSTAVLRDQRRVAFDALPPLSLYVHLPWCVRKCPYCDFNSHEAARFASGGPADLPFDDYVAALLRDLEEMLPSVWGRRLQSVFIGGGTPSLFPAGAIDALLSAVRARMPMEPGAEVTLEANPGTVEAARFRGYREAGVNRISVGVQSFDDGCLRALGRIHSANEARRAVDVALAEVGNVNLDLMYALPGQTLAMARADIDAAASLGVPHVSAYQLTLEPNTVFHANPPVLPPHDLAADMQVMVEEKLAEAGYGHYEVSAFARPGRRCRHNLNYWEFGDYLGIGAGAHGKISFADRVTRHERAKQPREYLAGGGRVAERAVPAADLPFEFMLNALRLVEGFADELFAARSGLPIAVAAKPLATAESRGWLERSGGRTRPTRQGRLFLDDLVALFLPAQK